MKKKLRIKEKGSLKSKAQEEVREWNDRGSKEETLALIL